MACVATDHPDRRNSERHLGVVGAQVFLDFIAFSGLPTGCLFAWAQLFKACLNPTGRGIGGGKLVRTDISKWKQLVRVDGKTDRATKDADLEFTIADFTLAGGSTKVHVLLVFERTSETLLAYTSSRPIDPRSIVARVLELALVATEKRPSPEGKPRRNVLWIGNSDTYRKVRESLRPKDSDVLPLEKVNPKQPNRTLRTRAGRQAVDGSKQKSGRWSRRFQWRTQRFVIYPDDWACELLPAPVLQTRYVVPDNVSLAQLRRQFQVFVVEFNQQGQRQSRTGGVTPRILDNTRRRDVGERLSV